ncbi:hypothetical protein [Baaleninema sp.]|uniref:hypothetical protein n=1 Tax=Baaleninema sp. TaxID=3101197 RepID=UPI003CFE87A9
MSAYTGPYQSRLFNFIADRTLRFGDAAAKAFRHAKFAVQTATQTLLYPVYAIFQTARGSDRQVASGSAATAEALPQSDTPVRSVLETLDRLEVSETPVCGIASSRQDGKLVLVAAENRILEPLSPEKQQQLENCVVAELSRIPQLSPSLSSPPVKSKSRNNFDRLMTWVRGSAIARRLNWFNEAALPATTVNSEFTNSDTRAIVSSQAVYEIDRRLATLESEYFLPIAESPEPPLEKLRHILKAAIDYFFGEGKFRSSELGVEETLNSPSENRKFLNPQNPEFSEVDPWLSGFSETAALPGTRAIASQPSQIPTFNLRLDDSTLDESTVYERVGALIEAAIAYFFNFDDPLNVPSQPPRKSFATPTASPVPDPWNFEIESSETSVSSSREAEFSQVESPTALPEGKPSNPFRQISQQIDRWMATGSLTKPSFPNRETTISTTETAELTPKSVASPQSPSRQSQVSPSNGAKSRSLPTQPSKFKTPQLKNSNTQTSNFHNSKTQTSISRNLQTRQSRQVRRQTETGAIESPKTATVSRTRDSINSANAKASNAPEFHPDWLEAQVEDSSYVKHPLEVVLEWLDRVMLKVELWIGKLWNWLFERLK